jgi:hypothetical protein
MSGHVLAMPQVSEGLPILVAAALGMLALGVLLCVMGFRLLRQGREGLARANTTACAHCGRKTAGLRAKFCPECGQALSPAATTDASPLSGSAVMGGGVMLGAGILLLIGGGIAVAAIGAVLAGSL